MWNVIPGKIISVVIQVPKRETVRTAESKLNCVISLKHVLQLVEPLKESLSYCENKMLKLFWKVMDSLMMIVIILLLRR